MAENVLDLLLSDEEKQGLIENLAVNRTPDTFTEEEATRLINWATQVMFNQLLIQYMLSGQVAIKRFDDGADSPVIEMNIDRFSEHP